MQAKAQRDMVEGDARLLKKDSSGRIYHGMLDKVNKRGKVDRRYVVLFANRLVWVKTKNDNPEKPRGMVKIGRGMQITRTAPGDDNPHFIVGENGDHGTKQYRMNCEDEEVLDKWFDVLSALNRKVGLKKDPDSIKEGYLKKAPKWNQLRYFVLHNNRLDYYRRFKDDKPAGSIPITSASLHLEEGGNKERPYMLAMANNRDPETRVYEIDCITEDWQEEWHKAIRRVARAKQPLRMVKDSLIEGWLLKAGNFKEQGYGKDNYRWCVLTNDGLSWYKHRKKAPKKRSGGVKLTTQTYMTEEQGDMSVFIVKENRRTKKQYRFKCLHDKEQHAWTTLIRQALRSHDKLVVRHDAAARVVSDSTSDSDASDSDVRLRTLSSRLKSIQIRDDKAAQRAKPNAGVLERLKQKQARSSFVRKKMGLPEKNPDTDSSDYDSSDIENSEEDAPQPGPPGASDDEGPMQPPPPAGEETSEDSDDSDPPPPPASFVIKVDKAKARKEKRAKKKKKKKNKVPNAIAE